MSLLNNSFDRQEYPNTAFCIHHITPLNYQMPSLYELQVCCKACTSLQEVLKSKHPKDNFHQKASQQHQTKQAEFYNGKVSNDK